MDSDNAGDKVSCRSRSGFLIDSFRGLRYKWRMKVISILSPSYIYMDNMPVLHNTPRTESVMRKKSNSVCSVCEFREEFAA